MKNKSVGRVILNIIKEKWLLTAGIVITVVGAIVTALFPPLIPVTNHTHQQQFRHWNSL